MGCLYSREIIDFNSIQPTVLRIKGGLANFSGTTERGRFQVMITLTFLSIVSIYFRHLAMLKWH